MRKIITVLFLVLSSNIYAQDNWLLANTKVDNKIKKPQEVINVVDEKSKNLAVFFRFNKTIKGQLYNSKQELISEVVVEVLPKNTSIHIGSNVSDRDYTLFFQNNSGSKFSKIVINFEDKSFDSIDDIGLKLKKEHIVDFFEKENQLYMLSIVKRTSILKIRVFEKDATITVKTIDLSEETFEGNNGLKTSLYTLIKGYREDAITRKVRINEPSSLDIASSDNKIYFQNNNVIITSDYFDKHTYFINIDIVKGKYEFKKFDNPAFSKAEKRNKANSFIYDNYFFNIYTTPKRLSFSVIDLNTREVVKELSITKKDSITFKNSPIILEGGELAKYRELERTAQFLRKVTSSNLGASVYENRGSYVITLGASEELPQASYMYFGGGLIGGLASAALISVFESYSKTKSTRIECLFDKNFNHIDGDIPLNGFDKIKSFISSNNLNKAPLQSVFRYKNDYIFGSYQKNGGFYRFVRFED